jgi:hypothetical protein
VTSSSEVVEYYHFRGPCYLYHKGEVNWNVGILPHQYTASQPRRLKLKFQTKSGKNQTSWHWMYGWHKQFAGSSCLRYGKSSEQPFITQETEERVQWSFINSSQKLRSCTGMNHSTFSANFGRF